jgi:hypothetical protein
MIVYTVTSLEDLTSDCYFRVAFGAPQKDTVTEGIGRRRDFARF